MTSYIYDLRMSYCLSPGILVRIQFIILVLWPKILKIISAYRCHLILGLQCHLEISHHCSLRPCVFLFQIKDQKTGMQLSYRISPTTAQHLKNTYTFPIQPTTVILQITIHRLAKPYIPRCLGCQ